MKHKERRAHALPLQGVIIHRNSHISADDRFAALTNCCAVRRGEASPNDSNIIPYFAGGCQKCACIALSGQQKRRPLAGGEMSVSHHMYSAKSGNGASKSGAM